MNTWQKVTLRELLTKSEDWITIHPDQIYKEVTVRLWGKGVALRGETLGSEIASSRLLVHANQFIISKIDARNGASGLIPDALEGAVVSNDFPVFTSNPARIDPRFLGWLSKTGRFVEVCRLASEGTTNRVRLKEERFLATPISLPPLAEQRRLIERIDDLAAKLMEAVSLVQETDLQREALCRSLLIDDMSSTCERTPMGELLRLRDPDVIVSPGETYHFAGVYCFGRGVFQGQRITGLETSYRTLTRLNTDNFVYPKLMAWEGALAVVPPECDGLVVSTEFPVFEVDQSKVLPVVLDVYFRTPSVWPQLAGVSTGTNARRRRLNPMDFLNYKMPVPGMETQQKLRQVRQAIGEIKEIRSSLITELDSMLPSILNKAFNGKL